MEIRVESQDPVEVRRRVDRSLFIGGVLFEEEFPYDDPQEATQLTLMAEGSGRLGELVAE